MPELPEVEVTRLSFADRISDARILQVRLGQPLRWPLGCAPSDLSARVIQGVRRRGKYLLLDLDRGLLLLHLGMSGSLRFSDAVPLPGTHDHFDLVTDKGTLRLNDPRRFGAVVYASDSSDPMARKLLDHLGVEPLGGGFELSHFAAALRSRRTSIKQVLLAGDVVVGVGNIYACEALFHAGIRPTAQAARLSLTRVRRLHLAIQTVLQQALASGGSSLRNFSNAHGQTGHFQTKTMVYGRAGQPCHVCTRPIRLLRQGQRSSFFCVGCQT